jgi:hypothetical protein
MSDARATMVRKLRHAMLCRGMTFADVDAALGWKSGQCKKLLTTHSRRLHLIGCADIATACGVELRVRVV